MAIDDKILENFFRNPPIKRKTFVPNNVKDKENETLHKPTTNLTQNDTQTLHKTTTNLTHKKAQKTQTLHKPYTQPYTQKTQTLHKPTTNPTQNLTQDNKTKVDYSLLVGLQKSILFYFFNHCRSHNKNEIYVCLPSLAETLEIKVGSINNTLYRMEKELKVIEKIKYKNGRGGWRVYQIEEGVYKDMALKESLHKPYTNLTQTLHKVNTKPYTEPYTSVSSSSSNINILKTTTTGEQEKQDIDPKWFEIDFEPLANIGFTETHLVQLAKQKILAIEQVQNSIYAFAFDLEHNEKAKDIKGNSMNYFMGIVRKGLPYTYPANYESPKDRETRLYVERMKELERKRAEMQKEALNLAFKEWFYKLPDNEVRKILPSNFPYTTGNIKGSIMVENAIKEHFSREIWANRQLEIINEGSNNAKDLSQVLAEEIE